MVDALHVGRHEGALGLLPGEPGVRIDGGLHPGKGVALQGGPVLEAVLAPLPHHPHVGAQALHQPDRPAGLEGGYGAGRGDGLGLGYLAAEATAQSGHCNVNLVHRNVQGPVKSTFFSAVLCALHVRTGLK